MDVYYRIYAEIIPHKRTDRPISLYSLYSQFEQRLKNGKCFHQPVLGTSDCTAFFSQPDPDMKPIQESRDLGIMLYDIFDIKGTTPLNTATGEGSIEPSYYHATMINGVIIVPNYESFEVLKKPSKKINKESRCIRNYINTRKSMHW